MLTRWRMYYVLILTLIFCTSRVECGELKYFDVAGVLPLQGYLSQDMVQAQLGYEFFCEYLAQQGGFSITHNNGNVFRDESGVPYKFAFNCSIYDNQGSLQIHMDKYRELLAENAADFYVGSHIDFEKNSSIIVSEEEKIIIQCCVGPEFIYEELDLPYQFGVMVSNTRYTELVMKEFGYAQVSDISIIRQSDNTFTMSTCEKAIEFAEDRGVNVSIIMDISREDGDDIESVIEQFVNETKLIGSQAIVACMQVEDVTYLTEQIDEMQLPLKAFFATAAPWYQSYIDEVGYLSEYVLSAGQWHQSMHNDDEYFGRNRQYVRKFKNFYDGEVPNYVAAGASVTMEVYMLAIQSAFYGCNVANSSGDPKRLLYDPSAIDCSEYGSNTVTGYDLILESLADINAQTFFGRIRFNKYRRNHVLEPATIQIQRNRRDELVSVSVLPVNTANGALKLPQPNPYVQDCPAGYKQPQDDFESCIPCSPGTKRCEKCSQLDCDYCARDQYNDKYGQSECQPRPKNTRTTIAAATNISFCQCKPNFFQPDLIPGEACIPCPIGGVCEGELSEMYPEKGYWMDPYDRNSVYACNPSYVCLGGEEMECAKGYSGRLCESCDEGYYQFFSACRKCPSGLKVIFQLCGIAIAWWIINAVISRQMETFDVILNWVQLLSVVGEFDVNWPSTVYTILQLAAIFAFEVDIIELDCLYPNWSFLHNFAVQLLLPILVAFIAGFSFLCTYIIYRLRNVSSGNKLKRVGTFSNSKVTIVGQAMFVLHKNIRYAVSMFVVIPETSEDVQNAWNLSLAVSLSFISISYLTLVKYSFDAFKCIDISGVYVLKTSVDIECHSDTHKTIQILGYLGIVFYVILFPIFALITLQYLKRKKAFHNKKQLERFGWLYHRYEVEWYWYEMSQIGHRLIFVVILVFIDSPSMQSSLATVVTTGLLMLHIYSRPYIDVVLDILHTFLQVALMLVILSGLVFYNPEVKENDRIVMEYFILVTLGLFSIVFVVFLIRNVYEKIIHSYASWRIKRVMGKISENLGEIENVNELLHTFELRFLIPWVRLANEDELKQLNKLASQLADYVSNESDTSYLSLTKSGRWWRFLSERFPEVIDFLAVVDGGTRTHFISFVEVLYQYFFRFKGSTNIYEMITWEDRAPIAQWLALASDEHRDLFNKVVKTSFQHTKGQRAALSHHMRVVTYGRMASVKNTAADVVESPRGIRELKRMGSSLGRMFSVKPWQGSHRKPQQPIQPSRLASLENRAVEIHQKQQLQKQSLKSSSARLFEKISQNILCGGNISTQTDDENFQRNQALQSNSAQLQHIQKYDRKNHTYDSANIDDYNTKSDIQILQEGNMSMRCDDENSSSNNHSNDDNEAHDDNDNYSLIKSDSELLEAVKDYQDLNMVGRYISGSGLKTNLSGQLGSMGPWKESHIKKFASQKLQTPRSQRQTSQAQVHNEQT